MLSSRKGALQYNHQTSKYALHAATQQHTFSNIQECTQILHTHNKGAHFNTIERFYILKEDSTNNHLNDDHAAPNSKIFQIILNDFLEESYYPLLLTIRLPARPNPRFTPTYRNPLLQTSTQYHPSHS